jgi:hypothetical protein
VHKQCSFFFEGEYPQLAIFFSSLRKLIPTKIIESTVIGFTIINDALLRTLYAYMYVHPQETIELSEEQPKPADIK